MTSNENVLNLSNQSLHYRRSFNDVIRIESYKKKEEKTRIEMGGGGIEEKGRGGDEKQPFCAPLLLLLLLLSSSTSTSNPSLVPPFSRRLPTSRGHFHPMKK